MVHMVNQLFDKKLLIVNTKPNVLILKSWWCLKGFSHTETKTGSLHTELWRLTGDDIKTLVVFGLGRFGDTENLSFVVLQTAFIFIDDMWQSDTLLD